MEAGGGSGGPSRDFSRAQQRAAARSSPHSRGQFARVRLARVAQPKSNLIVAYSQSPPLKGLNFRTHASRAAGSPIFTCEIGARLAGARPPELGSEEWHNLRLVVTSRCCRRRRRLASKQDEGVFASPGASWPSHRQLATIEMRLAPSRARGAVTVHLRSATP